MSGGPTGGRAGAVWLALTCALSVCPALCLVSAPAASCVPEADDDGGAAVSAVVNHDPVVMRIVPAPTRIDVGESTALRVTVSDPDGDLLFFDWTAGCDGAFAPDLVAEPTFTLAAPGGDRCTLFVEVQDGRGGVTDASVTITTGPALGG